MEFKLPIQYVSHQELTDTVKQDLELIDTHGLEPVCSKIFNPKQMKLLKSQING